MDVFVTGATGVLGRAVVPLLVAAGHRVRGLARSEQNAATLRGLGAEPVRADLFSVASLREAVAGSDAILHLATKIPPTNEAGRPGAWAENDRIRREGTRNLVDAALAAGVETLIYPSVCFVYRDGGAQWLEADTAALDPGPIRSTLEAEAEVARFAATGRRGITLRNGAFYGPDAPSTADQLRLARRGVALLIGAADAYQPMIWVDDAASAVVAALDRAPAGVYDIVDDEPLRRGELTTAFARAVGRRRLLRPPLWLARLLGGDAVLTLARSQRVTNRRFKAATGWAPAVPNARIGLARLASSEPGAPGGGRRGVPGRVRAGLLYLGLLSLVLGLWTQLAPRSFYDGFPGLGHAWVAVDGPYNEHLLRDFGATNLALAVVMFAALLRPTATLVRLAACSSLVWQAPHTLYHLDHAASLPALGDQVAQSASLLLGVVVALVLLWDAGRLDRPVVPSPTRTGTPRRTSRGIA